MPQLTPKLFRKKLSGVCVCGERERERKQMWQNVLQRCCSLFIQLLCRTDTFQNIRDSNLVFSDFS